MTLTLGLRPRQMHGKVRAKNATWESHLHSHLGFPFWELESLWNPKFLKRYFMGQTHGIKELLYIIKKNLKHRCLK